MWEKKVPRYNDSKFGVCFNLLYSCLLSLFQSKGYEISCDCLHLWVQFGPAASIVRIEYDHSMEMGIGVPRSLESFMVGGKLGS